MSKNTGTSELINYFDLGANGDVGIAGSLDINTIANATTDTDTFLVSDTGIIKYRTGTQLLSDIGAAPATGGSYLPLSGGILTGTTRMDGSGGTVPSITMIYNSGINRLLTPLLRLYGATNEASNYIELFGSLATSNRTINFPDASGTVALTSNIPANPVGGTGTSGTIPVFTGSTTIGNSIIQSNATQVNIVGNGSQLLFDSLGSAKDGGIQYVNDFTLQMYNSRGVGSSIYLGNNNLDLNINPSSNPRLRITSGGNVLINSTTDNGARLQVSGTATFSSSVAAQGFQMNGTGGYGVLAKADGINSAANGAYIGFVNNASSRYFISQLDTNNDINYYYFNGASWSSSLIKFTNTGAATFSNSITTSGNINVNSDGIFINRSTSGEPYVFFQKNGVNRGAIYGVTGGGLRIFDESDNQVLTITGTNVLIGTTTNNGAKLQVSGTATITGQMQQGFNQLRSSTGTQGVSTTADIFRFLNVSGGVNNGYYSAIFHVWVYDNNTGANSFSATYAVQTTSNGQTNAAFTQLASVVRGTNPVSSINLISDGAGGAAKISLTTTATPTSGVTYQCSAIGIF